MLGYWGESAFRRSLYVHAQLKASNRTITDVLSKLLPSRLLQGKLEVGAYAMKITNFIAFYLSFFRAGFKVNNASAGRFCKSLPTVVARLSAFTAVQPLVGAFVI